MKNVIFIKLNNAPFILVDQEIISSEFHVREICLFSASKKIKFIFDLAGLFFTLIFKTQKTDAYISWFADYHAAIMVFCGKLLRKKTIIFAGGQEAVSYPELGKGAHRTKFRSKFVRFALRNADLIIPNHRSLLYHENYYYSDNGKKDGINYYLPKIKGKIVIIENGYNCNKFQRDLTIEKDSKLVLCIGRTSFKQDIINKGFDLICELARRNKNVKFVIIGVTDKYLSIMEKNYRISELNNLIIKPFVDQTELFNYYNRAKVFVQASITEGMPNTLAEAMLFECVPVGSDVNGIPDTIGKTGVIIKHRNIEEADQALKTALTMNTGKDARQHIIDNFPMKKREDNVLAAINELLSLNSKE